MKNALFSSSFGKRAPGAFARALLTTHTQAIPVPFVAVVVVQGSKLENGHKTGCTFAPSLLPPFRIPLKHASTERIRSFSEWLWRKIATTVNVYMAFSFKRKLALYGRSNWAARCGRSMCVDGAERSCLPRRWRFMNCKLRSLKPSGVGVTCWSQDRTIFPAWKREEAGMPWLCH